MRFHRDPAVHAAWLEGQQAVAERAASRIPESTRVAWAAAVTGAALPGVPARSNLRPMVERVADLVPRTAGAARGLFDELRGRRNALDESKVEEDSLLALAELACKVAYNATGPDAPFDARSDALLAQAAAAVARQIPALEDALWNAVSRRP